MSDKRKRTIKMKKIIFAISTAPAAIPPKPKIAAIIAMTKKVIINRNIVIRV